MFDFQLTIAMQQSRRAMREQLEYVSEYHAPIRTAGEPKLEMKKFKLPNWFKLTFAKIRQRTT